VKFLFKVSVKISRTLDITREFSKCIISNAVHRHHHHFWPAPLTVRTAYSAVHSQQPPDSKAVGSEPRTW